MSTLQELAAATDTASACRALGIGRASWYRQQKARQDVEPKRRPQPAWALTEQERAQVVQTLHEPRFVDKAPAEVYATLLDEGSYLCSERTMYRILAAAGEVRERRDQLRHPHVAKPELIARAPNQVWSWDITKLKTVEKWGYYALYVVLDVFSRYVVGWTVALRENAQVAKHLIQTCCERQGIGLGQLTLHADHGQTMLSKTLAQLLIDLGVAKSHSRPHVSNDNPYSEAQFKTLKYRPDFPEIFGSLEDAAGYCRPTFQWYNHEHRHLGLGLLTPADVHYGRAQEVMTHRQQVLAQAHNAHPMRFRRAPAPPHLTREVWINRPEPGVVLVRSPTTA
jgi:putative transposase